MTKLISVEEVKSWILKNITSIQNKTPMRTYIQLEKAESTINVYNLLNFLSQTGKEVEVIKRDLLIPLRKENDFDFTCRYNKTKFDDIETIYIVKKGE